jgi:transposase
MAPLSDHTSAFHLQRRLSDRIGVGHYLSDALWNAFSSHLTEKRDGRGRPAFDKRKTFEAVLWVATTRRNWRELPARYGQWNSVYRQFSRWSAMGVWEFMRGQAEEGSDLARVLDEVMLLESRMRKWRRGALVARADMASSG